MINQYLTEAFTQLEMLNEEDYNVSDVMNKSDDFMSKLLADSEVTLDVIDPEAETVEDLEDSYIGKVIVDCCVCHSKLYKNKDEITIDETSNLVNADEECPFCYSMEGYKIVGEVAPFENQAEEDEVEETDENPEEEYAPAEEMTEELQTAVITTDDETITITSEENTDEDCNIGEVEVIAPVSDETQDELLGDELEVPIDEFDEENFDELGEAYLKKEYENINGYKTECIKQNGDTLIVEGIINFTSGNTKKTKFIFEAKDITKSGKVRFRGKNSQICRGKKAFTLTGNVNEGKFITESLNYNYRAKDVNGKYQRTYGTVRINK